MRNISNRFPVSNLRKLPLQSKRGILNEDTIVFVQIRPIESRITGPAACTAVSGKKLHDGFRTCDDSAALTTRRVCYEIKRRSNIINYLFAKLL